MRACVWLLAIACTGPIVSETDTSESDHTDVDTDTDPVDTGDPADVDGDGYTADEDCNDLDPRINPGMPEVAWNDVDDNCDGIVDANGTFDGAGSITFQATIEGRGYRWELDCPTVVTRLGWQIGLTMTCTPPDGDEIARMAIGEVLTITERDNIAEDALYSGVITVSSSDGWAVDGTGSLRWNDLDTVEGTVSMRAVFARLGGSLDAVR